MQTIDIEKIGSFIRDVAAEKIVPRFQQLDKTDIRQKTGPGDLVTIADEEAEIELTRILKEYLPGSLVLGEEAVSSGTVLRDILQDSGATVWIVDPVDGTNNFAHGRPVFGTMVSLVRNGERLAGWIYQIPDNRMIAVEKGAGIAINGNRYMPPSRPDGLPDFEREKGFLSKKFIPERMRPFVDAATGAKNLTTYMCCAYEYAELLQGGAVFSLYKRIEPWDHVAGAVILEEAGFTIRHWDRTPYVPGDLIGGLINAPSSEIWDHVYDTFLAPAQKAGLSL